MFRLKDISAAGVWSSSIRSYNIDITRLQVLHPKRKCSKISLGCARAASVNFSSINCEKIGWYSFPRIVVVYHRTNTSRVSSGALFTNGEYLSLVFWQSGQSIVASVTSRIARGPLLSPHRNLSYIVHQSEHKFERMNK